MRKFFRFAVPLTALLPLVAYAQTQATASAFLEAAMPKYEALYKTSLNLADMLAGGLNGDTALAEDVNDSLAAIGDFLAAWSAFSTVSTIYIEMVDRRDVNTVKSHLVIECKALVKIGDRSRASLNKILVRLKIDSIRAEVTRARDVASEMTTGLLCIKGA